MAARCRFHPLLSPYLDGELPPTDRRRVAAHLEGCRSCAGTIADLDQVGTMLRSAVTAEPIPELSGFADGIVTRIGAESAHSWRSVFHRAVEDARWALVGGGSFVGTCASILLVWLVIAPITQGETRDSMAAQLRALSSHSGVLMLVATPEGAPAQQRRVMLFDSGKRVHSVPTIPRGSADAAMVSRLMQMVTQGPLSDAEREQAEALVSELKRSGPTADYLGPPAAQLLVHEVHFVADVVTVRGL